MTSVDDIINETNDVREIKRALSVKMLESGMAPSSISSLLNVSLQYVSKWKVVFADKGVEGLRVAYRGGEGYLSEVQREAVVAWISQYQTLSLEAVQAYVETNYGIVYQSKQSYYDLLEAGGMSYHKSQKQNPKRDEGQVQARREEIKKNWHRTGKASNEAR